MLDASINDDFIFTEEAQYVEYFDLAKSTSKKTPVSGLDMTAQDCRVSRPREAEVFNGDREISDAKLAIRCKDTFQIQKATGELQMKSKDLETASHGALQQGFVASDSAQSMLLF